MKHDVGLPTRKPTVFPCQASQPRGLLILLINAPQNWTVARYVVISWGREVPLELHYKTYCQVKKVCCKLPLEALAVLLEPRQLGLDTTFKVLGKPFNSRGRATICMEKVWNALFRKGMEQRLEKSNLAKQLHLHPLRDAKPSPSTAPVNCTS